MLNKTVWVRSVNNYAALESALTECFQWYDNRSNALSSAKDILLKPNVRGCSQASDAKTTDPEFLYCVANLLRRRYSSSLTIADSSIIGTETRQAFETTGIAETAEQLGIPTIDLRDCKAVPVSTRWGLCLNEIEIYDLVLSKKYFVINLPKIKTTYATPVGVGIKNLKGLVGDGSKLAFHVKGIQRALVDLLSVIQPDLTIVDGIMGLSLNEPIASNVVVFGVDPVSVDTACAYLMEVDPFDVEHLYLSSVKGLGLITGFEVLGDRIEELSLPFKVPGAGISSLVDESPFQIIDGHPCSGCVGTLEKGLEKLRRQSQFDDRLSADSHTIGLAVGYELATTEFLEQMVFVGDCSFVAVADILIQQGFPPELIHSWREGHKIPGCPPTIDSFREVILRAIRGVPSSETVLPMSHEQPLIQQIRS